MAGPDPSNPHAALPLARAGEAVGVHQRLSLRRIGALVLAVFLASLLAGLAVRIGLLLMEQSEERPAEVDSS